MRFLPFVGIRLADCRIDWIFRVLHRISLYYGGRKIFIDDVRGHNFFFAFFFV